jgi:hypothetical protein
MDRRFDGIDRRFDELLAAIQHGNGLSRPTELSTCSRRTGPGRGTW